MNKRNNKKQYLIELMLLEQLLQEMYVSKGDNRIYSGAKFKEEILHFSTLNFGFRCLSNDFKDGFYLFLNRKIKDSDMGLSVGEFLIDLKEGNFLVNF